jgi:hypothetical protein
VVVIPEGVQLRADQEMKSAKESRQCKSKQVQAEDLGTKVAKLIVSAYP